MKVPVSQPDLTDLEADYVAQAVHSTWVSSSGEFIDKSELQVAALSGQTRAALTANGTVALHLALEALGIGTNDEVIVPALTFIASANAVVYAGATPVFVDVEEASFGLDPEKVRAAITSKTRAIIAVNLYGFAAPLVELRQVCSEYGIFLIEDNAEAFLGSLEGRPTGSVGDISTVSFFGNKILTSGEGGAICTSNSEIDERVRFLRGQAMDPSRRYFFTEIGYNYRMSNVSAALLLAQMERRVDIVKARSNLYAKYDSVLQESSALSSVTPPSNVVVAPWSYPVLARSRSVADYVQSELALLGIETRPFFFPLHRLPPYAEGKRSRVHGSLDRTVSISERGFNLPTASNFSREQVAWVTKALRSTIDEVG